MESQTRAGTSASSQSYSPGKLIPHLFPLHPERNKNNCWGTRVFEEPAAGSKCFILHLHVGQLIYFLLGACWWQHYASDVTGSWWQVPIKPGVFWKDHYSRVA